MASHGIAGLTCWAGGGMRIKLAVVVFVLGIFSGHGFGQVPGDVLLVVAHPDDEYYFAATVYRIAVQLHGNVDELVITNGEGGYRYSTLAEPYYAKALTKEAVGRKELPALRREETLNAGKVLGIRDHYFLDQKDEAFTTDPREGLAHLWDTGFVVNTITDLIHGKKYRYVFTVLPRASTHGHHQAATVLAELAIQSLPAEMKPVLLGFDTDGSNYQGTPFGSERQQWPSANAFAFNRDATFGFHSALSYQIIVNWMIAEHKSQGLLQTMCGKDAKEYAWVGSGDPQRAAALFLVLAHR